MSAENERQAAAEALEASQKIVTGSLVEGEDEGECPELDWRRCSRRHRLTLAEAAAAAASSSRTSAPPCSCERSSARHAARAAGPLISRCEFSSEFGYAALSELLALIVSQVWAYQCLHCNGKPVTQEGSGSGALSAHCQTWHGEIYRQACETSIHTKLQMRDGALVEM